MRWIQSTGAKPMDARWSKPKHDEPTATIIIPRKPNNLILTIENSYSLVYLTIIPKKLIIHSVR
jgi:hypothetical protein